jgi:hypothetical protein
MPGTSLATRRAEIARAERHRRRRPEDPARAEHAVDVRRDYATEKLAEYVGKVVAEAPPLTPAQRDRIAALLRGGVI